MRERLHQLGLALLAVVLGTCMACVPGFRARHPDPHPVRVGLVDDDALMVLATNWDTAAGAVERAYCVLAARHGRWRDTTRADSVWIVEAVAPVRALEATPDHITYACGMGVPSVHTHPWGGRPPTCDPSRIDYDSERRLHQPFAVVQCGPTYFRFYYPDGT